MIFSNALSAAEATILGQVIKDYFEDTDDFPISVQVTAEGQKLENNKFVIGCRAGPSCDLGNLLHEMGHFAEREPEKLLEWPRYAWGYTFGKYWEVAGSSGHEPQTDQAVRRELRIWAFQWNLEKHYGIESTLEDLVESAKYLNAFCLYNSYKDAARKQYRDEKERLLLAQEEVRLLSETTFTLDAFDKAWWNRIELLKKSRRK